MTDYQDVIEAIIEETRDVIGEVAIMQAREIDSISVDDEGKVTGDIDADDIQNLLNQYRTIIKGGADAHARQAVKRLYENNPNVADLDLPSSIMPREVRADSFASAF